MSYLYTTVSRLAVVIAMVTLLLGCESAPKRDTSTAQTMQDELREGATQAGDPPPPEEPPREVSDALLPPLEAHFPDDTREPMEERFDVAVRDAPAEAFFMGLVEDTPYNLIVHPAVEGDISLTLRNVTIPEVLDVVRDVYGYEYREGPAGYQVLPRQLQSRIFQVDYLNIQREGKSRMRVSSGQVSDTEHDGDVTGDRRQRGGGRPLSGSEIDTDTRSDFWATLEHTLETLVGNADGRRVVINSQSGTVVVRAMPDELREVEDFLAAVQESVGRQVILEAKIMEVELSDGFQTGINWAALGRLGRDRNVIFGQTGGGTIFGEDGRSTIQGNTGVLNPLAFDPIEGTDASAFGGVFTAALNAGDFTAFIELLETQGDVQVLSSPQVATLNNQKAVIKVGNDEFFVTDISARTTAVAAGVFTQPDITLTPFFSGIALDVTPQVREDGDVILHIHPSVTEVRDQEKSLTVGDEEQRLPLAFSTVRESDSIVRARSGQMVVIGGLMQTESEERRAQTPVLGDIPLVGNLFRHTQRFERKSELVILLRPIVVDDHETWAEAMGRSADRVQGIQQGIQGRREFRMEGDPDNGQRPE